MHLPGRVLQSGIYGDVPEKYKYAYSEEKKEARLAQQQLLLRRGPIQRVHRNARRG